MTSHTIPRTVSPCGERRRKYLIFTFALVATMMLSAIFAQTARAGSFSFTMVENKGTYVYYEPMTRYYLSYMRGICEPGGFSWPFLRINRETVWVPAGTITIYNIYTRTIHVPQPIDLHLDVDLYWLMAADTGGGIGGLPPGGELLAAELDGLSGTTYNATITPINDLSNLPTSSIYDTSIDWDLSALSQTTGNFYLAHVTMPGDEIVPEPATFCLLGMGMLLLARRRPHRA